MKNSIETPIGIFELNDMHPPMVMHKLGNDCIKLNRIFYLAHFHPKKASEPIIVGWIEHKTLEEDNYTWATGVYDIFVPLETKLYDVRNGHNRNFEE